MKKEIWSLVLISIEELATLAKYYGLDNTLEKWILDNIEIEKSELTDEILNEIYDAIMKYIPEIAIAENEEDDDEEDDEE